jgi:hypothetical protein
MTHVARQTLKQVLRVTACSAVVCLQQAGPRADLEPASLFAGLEARLVCDMRWWLQLAPLAEPLDQPGDVDFSANDACRSVGAMRRGN